MSTILAQQCDECGYVSADALALRLPALDLDFCGAGHLERYVRNAPKGEREAVEECLADALPERREQ